MIEIYGKVGCNFCEKAKTLCKTRSIPFSYFQLDRDFTRDELFEQFPLAKTFPQIRIHNISIGGYEQLITYIDETGFTGTKATL
jgi:glutaredoxin